MLNVHKEESRTVVKGSRNADASCHNVKRVKARQTKRTSMGIIYLFGVFDGAACAEEVLVTEGCS